jgi:F0F1-type ATP synthase epsilon subunit
MARIRIVGLLIISMTSIAIVQARNANATANSKAEQEIRRVEEKRREALLRSDTAALDQIFADEYSITNQFGQLQTKAQMMSALKSGALKFESIDEDDVIIRVYGDAAVVTGRATSKHEGRETTKVRFTRVYVKRRGQWQAVTNQVTRIALQ